MLFAFTTCRVDIGYAISVLSRHSNSPSKSHFEAAQNSMMHLIQTKEKGLIFQRPKTKFLDHLPAGEDLFIEENNIESEFELPEKSLIGYCDAAHATDHRTRRSTTGCAFCTWTHLIFCKVKLQATVATSSTEAEFIAAVSAAKTAKYLRTVLHEIGFMQNAPTKMHEDNMAAIFVANNNRPTDRTRHMDIQYFALQQWVKAKQVILQHIPGTLNPADGLTKALAWILHSRHANSLIGYFKRK